MNYLYTSLTYIFSAFKNFDRFTTSILTEILMHISNLCANTLLIEMEFSARTVQGCPHDVFDAVNMPVS